MNLPKFLTAQPKEVAQDVFEALKKKKNIQSQLDGIKVHAFLTGLLQVIRITNKVNTSGGLETYQAVKTASLLNKNLKKVISDFIESL